MLCSCKTKKVSMENNCRKFGDTTGKQKQYDSDEESASSREERRRRSMKLKMIALIEELLKKKIAQMRPPVKLRTFQKLLLHLQKDN